MEAEKILDQLKKLSQERYVSAYSFALAYLGLAVAWTGAATLADIPGEKPHSTDLIGLASVPPQFIDFLISVFRVLAGRPARG